MRGGGLVERFGQRGYYPCARGFNAPRPPRIIHPTKEKADNGAAARRQSGKMKAYANAGIFAERFISPKAWFARALEPHRPGTSQLNSAGLVPGITSAKTAAFDAAPLVDFRRGPHDGSASSW